MRSFSLEKYRVTVRRVVVRRVMVRRVTPHNDENTNLTDPKCFIVSAHNGSDYHINPAVSRLNVFFSNDLLEAK